MRKHAHLNAVWLVVCLLLTPRGALHAAEQRDLVLVAGQSNAVGFDAYANELPADPADKDVLFWWRCGDPPPDEHDSTCQAQALRAMLSALRKDLQAPQLIAMLGVNTRFGNDQNPFVPKIAEAQQAIAARDFLGQTVATSIEQAMK